MSRIGCALAVAGLVFALTAPAVAQSDANYPNKPIRIVVSVAAGGGVDLSARIIANHLQRLWGQPVTVENRTGGSSNIGGETVWRAAPDGYTLLATPPNTVTANAALFSKLNYDPATFEPVAIMALGANVLAVKNDSPVKTVSGPDRAREDRQAQLRLAGQWFDQPSDDRAVQEPHRRPDDARPLQRCGAGRERSRRRPCRHHVLRPRHDPAVASGRPHPHHRRGDREADPAACPTSRPSTRAPFPASTRRRSSR